MKVVYLACAISSAVDATTNRLSLFHLLEDASAPAFPTKLASFCIAILFERELDDEVAEPYLISIDLGGQLLLSVPYRADFSRTSRVRRVTTINDLMLPAPGTLAVTVQRRTTVLASWNVRVLQQGQQKEQPEGQASRAGVEPAARATPKRRVN